jgi:Escherichia/Staphylococcus phage prohead protease
MLEKRLITGCELRAAESSAGRKVTGYAARYGVLSHNLGQFRERIQPGAFNSVVDQDVVATFNHDQNFILGRTTSRTLKLKADGNGLAFECSLPKTSYADDLYQSIKRGDVNGCSFAFTGVDYDWDSEMVEGERCTVRSIKSFQRLLDISMVITPAYPGTNVDARFKDVVPDEVRSYVYRLTTKPRFSQAELQEQLDDLVDNRDMTKYPPSQFELAQQRKLRNQRFALLD